MSNPDWIGIGVTKCGTTWWHRNIVDHPNASLANIDDEVYEPPFYVGKQLHFFEQFCNRPLGEPELSGYHQFFLDDGKIQGEWSPNYFSCFWIPDVIKNTMPNVKLLVMLRDPVDRYESEVNHIIKYPPVGGPADINWSVWHTDFYQRGCYTHFLNLWLDVFPREQVLILQYEQCVNNFEAELAKTYRFLGLDDGFLPENRSNANPGSGQYILPNHIEKSLVDSYASEIRELSILYPEIDVDLWGRAFK